MSEQKYSVVINEYSNEWVKLVKPSFLKYVFVPYRVNNFKDSFTKSELAEIMDGALYREPFLGETGIQPEWINPLIELVPVEEED